MVNSVPARYFSYVQVYMYAYINSLTLKQIMQQINILVQESF